jgi:nuclear pore complex protein Nup205
MMHSLFSLDFGSLNLIQSPNMIEVSPCLLFMLSYAPGTLLIHVNFTAYQNQKSELVLFGLCFGLISYLYFLATKKNMRFQVSDVVLNPYSFFVLGHVLSYYQVSYQIPIKDNKYFWRF